MGEPQSTEHELSPSIGVVVLPRRWLSFYSTVARGFEPPTPGQYPRGRPGTRTRLRTRRRRWCQGRSLRAEDQPDQRRLSHTPDERSRSRRARFLSSDWRGREPWCRSGSSRQPRPPTGHARRLCLDGHGNYQRHEWVRWTRAAECPADTKPNSGCAIGFQAASGKG